MRDFYVIRAKGVYDSQREDVMPVTGMCVLEGKIHAIGPCEELATLYPLAERLDYSDCFLFPGLINTHVHLEFNASATPRADFLEATDGIRLLQAAHNANALLRSGVTTIRDAGSTWRALDLAAPQAQALKQMPRMQLAGPPLTVTGGHLHFLGEETDGLEDMVRQVRLRQKRGCTAIKLIVTGGQMTPGSVAERTSLHTAEIAAVTEEAHLLGLRTFAHCLTTEGFRRSMDGGVDCIEHVACFIRNQDNHLLERVYEPNVMEAYRGMPRYFMKGLSCSYHALDAFREGKAQPGPNEIFWLEQETRMFDIFQKCIELGLTPVLGTDAGTAFTDFSESWLELALMVERGGRTPKEAIAIGTVNSAACLGLERTTGRLREGYAADVIALRENPLENIRALGRVEHVMCRGVITD